MLLPGIEPATPCHSNQYAIGAVNEMLLKFYFFTLFINQHVLQCMYEIDFG